MAATPLQITVTSSPTLLFQIYDAYTWDQIASPTANQLKAGDVNAPLPLLLLMPSTTIYLGGSAVTSSTGVSVSSSTLPSFSYNAVGNDSLYACTASGSATVQILVLRQ